MDAIKYSGNVGALPVNDKTSQRDDGPGPSDWRGRLVVGEIECLRLVAKGMVSKEIARVLDISPHTVDARLRAATRKMGARNRFVAAQTLIAYLKNEINSESSDVSNLICEDLNIPADEEAGETEASAGEGNDPADLRSEKPLFHEERADIQTEGWLRPSHPFAKFFGGDNQLSLGRRMLLIVGISIGSTMAFTAVVNSLIGLSRLISPP